MTRIAADGPTTQVLPRLQPEQIVHFQEKAIARVNRII